MNSDTLGDATARVMPILVIVRFPLDPLLLLSYCHKEGRMFCWRMVTFRLLVMFLLAGSFKAAGAQTVYREIGQHQNQLRQTAVIGLLGEFNQCAAYEVATQDLDLNKLISQAGGMTSKASGIIRIIRGGRISQDLFYSPNTNFTLMHGDVLVGLESSANDIDIASDQNGNGIRGNQQAPQALIQIAILNLLDRPVVFGVPAEIADLAGILRCLRQPLEQYPQIAQTIKIIPPKRIHNSADFKSRKLSSKFASGTVLVLGSSRGIDLSMIPRSLPGPRPLRTPLSTIPELPNKFTQPVSVSQESGPFRQANSVTEDAPQIQHGVTHPEDIPKPLATPPLKTNKGSLQFNGPALQQTAASLTLVPKPNHPQHEENAEQSVNETENQKDADSSTVPQLDLTAAPAPPSETVHVLSDDDLPKSEEADETAGSSSWPQWFSYLLLAAIAGGIWKYLQKRTKRRSTTSHSHPHTASTGSGETQPDTIITNWDSLPPLPKKSLLEQILENDIPIIEETPQIPTQTFIYGRHQTRSARIDQKEEILKGPHFTRKIEPEQLSSETQETTNSAPATSAPPTTEKKLKAPAFRFDRSHPGATQPGEEKVTPAKTGRSATSNQKQSAASEAKQNSGILDRVLQAVQGVMPK